MIFDSQTNECATSEGGWVGSFVFVAVSFIFDSQDAMPCYDSIVKRSRL